MSKHRKPGYPLDLAFVPPAPRSWKAKLRPKQLEHLRDVQGVRVPIFKEFARYWVVQRDWKRLGSGYCHDCYAIGVKLGLDQAIPEDA